MHFGYLNKHGQWKNSYSSYNNYNASYIIIVLILIAFASIIIEFFYGGSYYRHRGFYGGYYGGFHGGYYGGCVHHSSCACAHSSCACACACAGSGRAGCSKKDFYGTKLNKEKLSKVF